MRILLVDHDAAALDKVSRALRGVVELDCVSSKADALMLIKQNEFDVLIACERASDGSGLDLLGRLGKQHAQVKRIFSAAPERLQLLGTRLQPFNVTRTISYPIDLEELWLALAAVTSGENASIEGTIEHIVMDETGIPGAKTTSRTTTAHAAPTPAAPAAPAAAAAVAGAQGALVKSPSPPSAAPAPRVPAPTVTVMPPAAPPLPATVAPGVPSHSTPPTAPRPAVAHAAPAPTAAASAASINGATAGAATARKVMPAPAAEPAVTPARRTTPLATSQSVRAAQAAKAALAAAPAEAPAEAEADPSATTADAILSNPTAAGAAPSSAKRKPFPVAVVGGLAAAIVIATVVVVVMFREPAAQPVVAATATTATAETSKATQIDALESRIEDALMRDDLATATAAQAELAALEPTHPRLAFFAAALRRASELNALNQAETAPPPMSPNNPPARAAVTPPPATRAAETSASGPVSATQPAVPTEGSASPAPADVAQFAGRTVEEGSPAAPKPTRAANSRSATRAVPTPVAPAAQELEKIGPAPAPTAAPINEVTPAKLKKRFSPEYPSDAAARGTEGFAMVEFTVMTNGRVKDVVIVESSPRRTFDSAARNAVKRWQFEPAMQNGSAVESKSRVRLDFRLKD